MIKLDVLLNKTYYPAEVMGIQLGLWWNLSNLSGWHKRGSFLRRHKFRGVDIHRAFLWTFVQIRHDKLLLISGGRLEASVQNGILLIFSLKINLL